METLAANTLRQKLKGHQQQASARSDDQRAFTFPKWYTDYPKIASYRRSSMLDGGASQAIKPGVRQSQLRAGFSHRLAFLQPDGNPPLVKANPSRRYKNDPEEGIDSEDCLPTRDQQDIHFPDLRFHQQGLIIKNQQKTTRRQRKPPPRFLAVKKPQPPSNDGNNQFPSLALGRPLKPTDLLPYSSSSLSAVYNSFATARELHGRLVGHPVLYSNVRGANGGCLLGKKSSLLPSTIPSVGAIRQKLAELPSLSVKKLG